MSMDSAFLDQRDNRAERDRLQRERDAAERAWFGRAQDPAARLVKFDTWLRRELDARLDWAWAGAAKQKRIEQCRVQLDGMVVALWRRGWALDGARLAARIKELLDAVGKAQREGKVRDFWPYFKASADRYVGLNAEELREEAKAAGAAVADVFQQLLKRADGGGPSMTELVAQRSTETLREKANRIARQNTRGKADASQLPLL